MEVWQRDLSRFSGLGAEIKGRTSHVGRTLDNTSGSKVRTWGVMDDLELEQPSWGLES